MKVLNENYNVVSKPGLPDWDKLLPSTELLAQFSRFNPSNNILLFGSHHGALGAFITKHLQKGQLTVNDNNFISLDMTRRTLSANNMSSVNLEMDIDLTTVESSDFDTVIIQITKGRKLIRRWLLQAYRALKIGASLYIAGSNNSGIQSSIKDAMDLFGNGRVIAYKKGNRVAHLVKPSNARTLPAWTTTPGIKPNTWVEFDLTVLNHKYQIRSLPGVFSYDRLDPGTEMLLDIMSIPPGAKVLDIGCGYGIIGLYAATHGAAWVDLTDHDFLAVASAKETLSLNGIKNASTFAGDILETVSERKYDLILSNPPFHAGLAVDYQIAQAIINQSYQALNPRGQLIIVANRFIPYNQYINQTFDNVTCLAQSEKFHVLSGQKL